MKNRIIALLVASVLLAVGTGAGFYMLKKKEQDAELQEIREQARLEEVRALHRMALYKKFETILNAFIADFSKQISTYKKHRSILKEILLPYNFETPEYAKESYETFHNEIAPSLRREAISVMDVFASKRKDVKSLLKSEPPEDSATILDEWKKMETEKVQIYIDFFDSEDALLKAYDDLLKFYYVQSNFYTVDRNTGVMEFKDENIALQEKELLGAIDAIKNNQKKIRSDTKDVGFTKDPGYDSLVK